MLTQSNTINNSYIIFHAWPRFLKAVHIIVVLSCGLSMKGFCQKTGQSLIDSLVAKLPKHKDDTNKVVVLNEISRQYATLQIDSMLYYATTALQSAKRINWKAGIADAYHYMAYAYYAQSKFEEALKIDDTLLQVATLLQDNKRLAVCYSNLGGIYLLRGDFTSAERNMLLSLELKKRLNDKSQLGDGYNNVATVYQAQSKYNEALSNYDSALWLFYKIADKEGIASVFYNKAIIYFEQGRTTLAIKSALDALKINSERGNERGMVQAYNVLGNIYQYEKDLPKSLSYYQKSLAIAIQLADNIGVNNCLNNIADIYYQSKRYPDALRTANEVLGREANSDKMGSANAYNTIGSVFKDTKDYKESLANYGRAYGIFDSIGNKFGKGNVLVNISMAFLEMGNYKQAESHLLQAIDVGKKVGLPSWLPDAYRLLSTVYEHTQHYHEAIQSFKQYIRLRDSSVNLEHAKTIIQTQDQYEYDKKADSVKSITQKQLAVNAANHRATVRVGLISVIALLLLLGAGFYFFSKRRQDAFKLELAAVRQEALNAQMSDHFVGNTMRTVKKYMRDNEPERAGEYLALFSSLVRKVLHNSFERLISLAEDVTLLKDYITLESARFTTGIDFSISLDPEIDVQHALVPPMIFQVLAENAIHHGLQNSSVRRLTVSVCKKDSLLECSVEDSGIGRAAALKEMTEGSRKPFGGSIAEKLVRTVHRYGRQMRFEVTDLKKSSGSSAGTLVTFTLPYNLDN